MRTYTEVVRKYYKYTYTEAFTPIFNNQEEAEFGKQNVKMVTTLAAYGITGNSTIVLANGNVLTFDLGEGSKNVSSLGYIGVVVSGQYPGIVLTAIQGSADAQTWETISDSFGGRGDYRTNPLTIATPNNYRYIRFTTSNDDYGWGIGGAYGLVMYYDKRESIESTEDDYDVYKDISVAKSYSSSIRKYYKKRDLIPTMTDYTTPYGEVTLVSGSYFTTNYPYQMFGQHIDNSWQTHITSNPFIVRYTFEEPIEPGINVLSFKYCQDVPIPSPYGNRALTSYTIEFNYSDGTSEIIVSKTDFINYAGEFIHEAINSKQLVSITITLTGNIYNTAWGSIYDFLMTHIVESTKDDYDFYLDEFDHSVYRKTIRKYYKYQYEDLTQPIVNTYTTSVPEGTITISSGGEYNSAYACWLAMDGNLTSEYASPANWYGSWWKVVYPYTIEISNINFIGRGTNNINIYSDESGIKLIANGNIRGDVSINNVRTNTIYITFTGDNTCGISEITLTAKKYLGIIEATEDDYDFYKDVDIDELSEVA